MTRLYSLSLSIILHLSTGLGGHLSTVASGSQSPAPVNSPRICTCEELKKKYRDLKNLSLEELRKLLYKEFRDQIKPDQEKAYMLGKYYLCRISEEESELLEEVRNYSR